MKRLLVLSAIATISMLAGTPGAWGHVGHGDEFQAEGGVDRVEVNEQTDSMFGIQVEPIALAEDAVMIPITALVEDGDQPLVFVRYENFYEPVRVVTGEAQGDRVEILEGLTAGEELVTAGSLALYAESRKTQGADVAEEPEPTETVATESIEAESIKTEPIETEAADRSVDAAANTATASSEVAINTTEEPLEPTPASSGLPLGLIGIGVGVVLVAGAAFVLTRNKEEEV
jgi:cation efflux system membrane fusion protein